MNLAQYLEAKKERELSAWKPRTYCERCRRCLATCYCKDIVPFSSSPQFAILIHKVEIRRSVATGWMSHICLENSFLFEGTDFTDHAAVNALIADPQYYPVVLFPARNATNLTELSREERLNLFPKGKKPLVFIIDGTWGQAKRMKRLSKNLAPLPFISFVPPKASGFLVRRQPHIDCYSTIESIHHLIDLLGTNPKQEHNQLIDVFSSMVKQQANYVQQGIAGNIPRRST